jgi:hypothetical protein
MAGERTDPCEFVAMLESLGDDGLLDFRFELYDRLEVAADDSDTYRFARAALDTVYAVERRRDIQRGLRTACRVAAPDADPDAFVEALFLLARHQRQLGSDDTAGVFAGALEVAQRRAEGKHDVSGGPTDNEEGSDEQQDRQ